MTAETEAVEHGDASAKSTAMTPVTRTFSARLKMTWFSTAPENFDAARCLACDVYLELVQPGINSPDRLIGICERCQAWYVIDFDASTADAVMVLLPARWPYRVSDGDGQG